ncbi:hypothetical protein [Acutalibacter caecimuris]|nr:hypothetical protein [Acutalibacter sp. M00118]
MGGCWLWVIGGYVAAAVAACWLLAAVMAHKRERPAKRPRRKRKP